MFLETEFQGCRQTPVFQRTSALETFQRIEIRVSKTCLCNRIINDLLIGHIRLIANKQLVHALCGIAIDLLKPLLDVVERVHIRHIVYNTDTVRASIIRGRDGSESLLACGIPLFDL